MANTTVTGGTRGLAPMRYIAEPLFLLELKSLFWKNQAQEAESYEQLIYDLEPPADGEGMNRLLAFRGAGPVPALGKKENAEKTMRVMRTIRYPDTEALMTLREIEGLTLPALTTLLHFHHPAFPLYSESLVDGLNRLGIPVVYRAEVSEESILDYAGVIAALDRLKRDVTFENVPESNCYLTRVVEGALVEVARSDRTFGSR